MKRTNRELEQQLTRAPRSRTAARAEILCKFVLVTQRAGYSLHASFTRP